MRTTHFFTHEHMHLLRDFKVRISKSKWSAARCFFESLPVSRGAVDALDDRHSNISKDAHQLCVKFRPVHISEVTHAPRPDGFRFSRTER